MAVLYLARSVFAPAAVSLFAVAVVWPVQKWLEERLRQLVALAVTLLLTMVALGALLALSVWGIGQVGRWMIVNAAHLQESYGLLTQWLESQASSWSAFPREVRRRVARPPWHKSLRRSYVGWSPSACWFSSS
ncbi:MAG TPA: hypothetical protein VIG38_08905 [Hyphomicrobium sp.]